ncbi:activating signal cointegrator 1 complex subunit 2 homolog isoform X2 [Eutrema salsugineum]|uniref:activating signal cointegrator 1 complex subunit 2 homolog isoform X2 n=1 Tax=Eutrema salsugineum TaxID=72664 RepID=UPI000CED110A|nr:activating signal cointegrator 1 complex subunit 2 homolog isoform X2 [Eutrema salsugineum]
MAGNKIGRDGGLPADLTGMTKSQLYDIMSQMKALIDQNYQQAREILIQNPPLTKTLFQAQIMLGMVQPPQVIPKVEPQVSQTIPPKPNVQAHISSVQGGGGLQEPAPAMQPQAPIRKHPTPQPMPMPPPSVSTTINAPSQPPFTHPQRQGHLNPAGTSLSHPQSSQVQSVPPPVPHHPTSQPPPFHHLDMPASSTQLQQQQQQPMHSGGGSHLAQQQPRPYHHQFGPAQTGPNTGFQHHGAPSQHHSQPMFHSGNRPPASGGPQFPQGQPHLPSQPPYQISAEMEKALLQQVMSLTPEQINLLPPEQRNQVLQLQQILRQ